MKYILISASQEDLKINELNLYSSMKFSYMYGPAHEKIVPCN